MWVLFGSIFYLSFYLQIHHNEVICATSSIREDNGIGNYCQGSHSDWKTWKNGKAFSSQGKVREF